MKKPTSYFLSAFFLSKTSSRHIQEKMIYRKIGSALLVAGTCIGSGMIALPLVLAKLGLIPSVFLMLFVWFIMYYTSLINLELNLQAKQGLSLGELGGRYSGKKAEAIGVISLKLLSFSLLAVFIYGGSSIVQKLLEFNRGVDYSFVTIATCYALIVVAVLLLPIKLIDYFNRCLFISLLIVVAVLILALTATMEWSNLPLFSKEYTDLSVWTGLIPVVFTSFGFQVIFHTLTNYCNLNAKMLKQAFFWGSLIPAIVYILWTCSILSVIYHENPAFFDKMIKENIEVGELIKTLGDIAKWRSVQLLVWWISLLAIATSVIGVGVGLCDYFKKLFTKIFSNNRLSHLLASLATVLPAYLAVIYIPNAFVAVLGFSGMILAVIAILLPAYLFKKVDTNELHYPELKFTWLIKLSIGVGVVVIISELFNMIYSQPG